MAIIDIDKLKLSHKEYDSVYRLLGASSRKHLSLEEMWGYIDYIWDSLGCKNNDLDLRYITKFYNHPVWLLNGIFIESDEESMSHRRHIAEWIYTHIPVTPSKRILDFGGGFGTLSKLISEKSRDLVIDIYEPYPSEYGKMMVQDNSTITFVDIIEPHYDCILCIDVLEHVEDPLELLYRIIHSIKPRGYLIVANQFSPVIKCHLPVTFHLRYTFAFFALSMGILFCGKCKGSHASVYRRIVPITLPWKLIRFFEKISQCIYPLLEKWHFKLIRYNNLNK